MLVKTCAHLHVQKTRSCLVYSTNTNNNIHRFLTYNSSQESIQCHCWITFLPDNCFRNLEFSVHAKTVVLFVVHNKLSCRVWRTRPDNKAVLAFWDSTILNVKSLYMQVGTGFYQHFFLNNNFWKYYFIGTRRETHRKRRDTQGEQHFRRWALSDKKQKS